MKKKKQKGPQHKASVRIADPLAKTRITVVGVGGGGGNIVSEIAKLLKKADFVAANTDSQALKQVSRNIKKFSFGQEFTQGLGCGMDANLGQLAAESEKENIKKMLEGNDLCILVSSLGGGTGSGAAPVFAEACNSERLMTIGIFTMPFSFEGEKRRQIAEAALQKLQPLVNAYVLLQNDSIFNIVSRDTPLRFAFGSLNKKLAEVLGGLLETLFVPGLINTDFADIKTMLQGKGRLSFLSSGSAAGEERAKAALGEALSNTLYQYGPRGAERILFNVAGSKDMKMQEVAQVSNAVFQENPRAKIIFGITSHPRFRNKLRVTLFAIGCAPAKQIQKEAVSRVAAKPKQKVKKPVLKQAPRKARKVAPQLPLGGAKETSQEKPRRNALEVKEAIDQEIQDLQEQEKKWDTPAFLRFRRT
ncbi:MAG: cell division protein FtsZ [bacterium]|nr:cell division protein FtsZ [bacterium]